MADYDCEYCRNSINNGGKCSKFEYDCPFIVISKYNKQTIQKFQNGFKNILNELDKMIELDTEYHFDELEYIKEIVIDKQEVVSEQLFTEWKEMINDNKKYEL